MRHRARSSHTPCAARLACLLAAVLPGAAAATSAPPASKADRANPSTRPPVIAPEVFARPAAYTDMQLSPLGRQAVARSVVDGKECIVVIDLEAGKGRMFELPPQVSLLRFGWAGEHRVLFGFGASVRWFDSEAYASRLMVHDLRTNASTFIGRREGGLEGDEVIYVDPDGEWLLISLQRTPYEYPAVYRADLGTGALKQVVAPQPQVWDWYSDRSGTVRMGLGRRPGSWFLVYRKTGEEKFRRTVDAKYGDTEAALDNLQVSPGSDEGFLLSDHETGRFAVYRYNFATGAFGSRVFESPTNDVDDFELSEDGRSVVAVSYVDDRARTRWLHPVFELQQLRLDEALPGRMNRIVSMSRDRSQLLMWSGAANDPGAYYLFVPATAQLKRIAVLNDGLDPAQLPTPVYTRYAARDGLEIPAYLTLPLGRAASALPLIVMPHGGPYGVRDELAYHPEVQFLANRGYAVLQPNFRGSAGYGASFYESGRGQWGRRMQDDLDDGVQWLVGRGIVDPKRVCLAGGSYGGYAALWGATRNPEIYRCAASIAGISDVGRHLKYQLTSFGDRRSRKDWRTTVEGDGTTDIDSISPLFGIAALRVPVLLAHGDEDQVVPIRQSAQYATALRKAGKAHEYHVYEGEGHGLADPANFADWLRRLEAFLRRHNPAD